MTRTMTNRNLFKAEKPGDTRSRQGSSPARQVYLQMPSGHSPLRYAL